MSKPLLFPTSVVGSLPRPAFVLDLINDRPPLPPERYEHEMQAAVRYAVAMQEHAGLDVITDGEWWRKSYIGVIAELAHGFELGTLADGRPFTLVVDKLAPKTPGFIAREVTFLKTITNRLIKSTLPRRRCSASACGMRTNPRKPIRNATISCAPACRFCAANWNSCATPARTSRRSTTRTFACSSIRRCAANIPIPTPRRISRWTWSTKS